MDKKLTTDELRFAILAADVVLFTIKENKLFVRLTAVNRPPAFPAGSAGFPGGLIHPKETAEEATTRILAEKAGIDEKKIYIEQLYTFSQIDRDPRGRVVAVSYIGLVAWDKLSKSEQDASDNSWWVEVGEIKKLAYDHNEMFEMAIATLRTRVKNSTIISKALAEKFTLGELERAYACILATSIDKRNFRKKITKIGILKELKEKQVGEPFRPAKLYKFISKNIETIGII